MKIWSCKIGEVDESKLPNGADSPMRWAIARAYEELTGEKPTFIFSGWGAQLTESERAVVEDRLPMSEILKRAESFEKEIQERMNKEGGETE